MKTKAHLISDVLVLSGVLIALIALMAHAVLPIFGL